MQTASDVFISEKCFDSRLLVLAGNDECELTTTTRPWLTNAVFILSDVFAMTVALWLALGSARHLPESLDFSLFLDLLPLLGLVFLAFAMAKLYCCAAMSPVEELRKLSLAITIVYVTVGATTVVLMDIGWHHLLGFSVAWLLSIFLVALSRALARMVFAGCKWWGYSAIILGAGKTGEAFVKTLDKSPHLGIKAVAILDDDPGKRGTLHGIPVLGKLDLAATIGRKLRISHCILAMPGLERQKLIELLQCYSRVFRHVLIIPDLFGCSSLGVRAKDLSGILGLEIRHPLLLRGSRFAKRTLDLVVCSVFGIFALPLILIISALIKLDSRGPVFFLQKRPGQDHKLFKIYKFRTMHMDAERRFNELPEELKKEFELHGKIKEDPRVTRVGFWLRRLSLDELPQVWNVMKGDMSVVGPRPYLTHQMAQMDNYDSIVLSVLPGLTGFWQVNGRSKTTFEERLEMDAYYVRNWSLWLDIYILSRTLKAVVSNNGAY